MPANTRRQTDTSGRAPGRQTSGPACWLLLLCLAASACVPAPQADAREQAIRTHFHQLGYEVVDLSLGDLRRNPPAERVYMAPLTYVVDVRSVTLARKESQGQRSQRTSTNATIKIQAPGGQDGPWTVSQVTGVELP